MTWVKPNLIFGPRIAKIVIGDGLGDTAISHIIVRL